MHLNRRPAVRVRVRAPNMDASSEEARYHRHWYRGCASDAASEAGWYWREAQEARYGEYPDEPHALWLLDRAAEWTARSREYERQISEVPVGGYGRR